MYKGGIAGLLLALLCATAGARDEAGVIEGLWQFNVRYDFIGVPQHFPEYQVTQCITDAVPIPAISRTGQECHDRLQGRFGRTFTWQLDCSTEWEMVQGMGRIHYTREEAASDVYLQVLNPYNPPQPMVFHLHGKRLGECP